jgi:hypothetical protein
MKVTSASATDERGRFLGMYERTRPLRFSFEPPYQFEK